MLLKILLFFIGVSLASSWQRPFLDDWYCSGVLNKSNIDPKLNPYFENDDPWSTYNDYYYRRQPEEWKRELKFLRYIQDRIDGGTLDFTGSCISSYQDYKRNILIGDKFQENFKNLCKSSLDNYAKIYGNPIEKCVTKSRYNTQYDHLCMIEQLSKYNYDKNLELEPSCKTYMNMFQHLLLSGVTFIPSLSRKCEKIAIYVDCPVENGAWISPTSKNYGLDCWIRKLFNEPINEILLKAYEEELSNCGNEVIRVAKVMLQQSEYDRVLRQDCYSSTKSYGYRNALCQGFFVSGGEYLFCMMDHKNKLDNQCKSTLNSRLSLIGAYPFMPKILHARCNKEISTYDCLSKSTFIDMVTCLMDGKHKHEKDVKQTKNSDTPSKFDNRDLTIVSEGDDTLFDGQCRLELEDMGSMFLKEPRLTSNLNIDCGWEIEKYCSHKYIKNDGEIIPCLMWMASGRNLEQVFSDQCMENLDKIVQVAEIGVQPAHDEKVYMACHDHIQELSKEASYNSYSANNLFDDITINSIRERIPSDYRFYYNNENIPEAQNYSDPCTGMISGASYFRVRNIPESIVNGHYRNCKNTESQGNYRVATNVTMTSSDNPINLLRSLYGLDKNKTRFLREYSYNYFNDYWKITIEEEGKCSIVQSPREYLFKRSKAKVSNIHWGFVDEKALMKQGERFNDFVGKKYFDAPVIIKDGNAYPYFPVYFQDGTICKETGKPRTATVLNYCNDRYLSSLPVIPNEPCERQLCHLEIEVYLPDYLCNYQYFQSFKYLEKSAPVPEKPTPTPQPRKMTWKPNPFTYGWEKFGNGLMTRRPWKIFGNESWKGYTEYNRWNYNDYDRSSHHDSTPVAIILLAAGLIFGTILTVVFRNKIKEGYSRLPKPRLPKLPQWPRWPQEVGYNEISTATTHDIQDV